MAIATARLRCCERSFWHCTTILVGRWVMRTAESVLLMCWPPAPEALKVSMRKSAGVVSVGVVSSASGEEKTLGEGGGGRAVQTNRPFALKPGASGLHHQLERSPV